MNNFPLAGFGNRLVAQLIDGIILGIAFSIIIIPFGGLAAILGLGSAGVFDGSDEATAAAMGLFGMGLIGLILFSLLTPFLYDAFMVSSAKQATLGKMIMKIKVVGPNGERLTFSQALVRSLIKYISSHFCILLWLWPLFNPEEQALHDLAAKSLVIREA
ncbi:RDD family protein [Runella limosa]|uniref:RDD family protein n=1 Tax=Runella limosa TaxID=370978 RepID=UPI000425449E|nr:RDD family protein [Runella limosa]